VNETGLQSALREMRSHFGDPATLFALGAVAAVLTLVAPFGTDTSLTTGFRAVYWLVIVLTTYTAGFGVDILLRPHLPHRLAQAVNPFVVGLVVTGVVVVVNLLLMGRVPGGRSWVSDLLTIYAIAALVAAAMQTVLASLAHRAPRSQDAAAELPAILDRLPLDKRGDLVALSVEDHYVRVRTVNGEEMTLMRLSDAIRETAPVPGLRVHRSHWVAVAQVTSARRDGDRAILGMAHGGDIPVSRSHIPAVREAGLLPK
jgi:DNA-binding LytR/AlgR family response regulator